MASNDLIQAPYYDLPAGIDQSPQPRAGSVRDCRNVDTIEGHWTKAPGLTHIAQILAAGDIGNLIAEYKRDSRFATSLWPCLLIGIIKKSAGVYTQYFYEVRSSSSSTSLTPVGITVNRSSYSARYAWMQGLWRYTADDGSTAYTPCLVLTDGKNPALIYHQKDAATDGYGKIEELDAIDGGYAQLGYLEEVPRNPKICVEFKKKLFILNTTDGGNRVYNTSPDSGGNFVVNAWPSSYNFDVGTSGDIIGALPFDDFMYIFKANETWRLSGDGVDGLWELEQVDSQVGVLSHWSAVNVHGTAVLSHSSGLYVGNGGPLKNISHPRLQETWSSMVLGNDSWFVPFTLYNPDEDRVIFFLNRFRNEVQISWDRQHDAFCRWGVMDGKSYSRRLIEWGIVSNWFVKPKNLIYGTYGGELLQLGGDSDERSNGNFSAIYWYIRTHKYLDDAKEKLMRSLVLQAKRTGEWNMMAVLMREDETPEQAFRRAAGKWNIICESSTSATHTVSGTSNFTKASDGPVDVWWDDIYTKMCDSYGVAQTTGADKIVFDTSFTSVAGEFLVVPEDKVPSLYFPMYDSDSTLLDDSSSTYDDVMFDQLDFERMKKICNLRGRSFSFLFTNLGSGTSLATAVVKGMPFALRGWEIWYRRRSVLR